VTSPFRTRLRRRNRSAEAPVRPSQARQLPATTRLAPRQNGIRRVIANRLADPRTTEAVAAGTDVVGSRGRTRADFGGGGSPPSDDASLAPHLGHSTYQAYSKS
jgi:hypothetical protein